MKNMNCVSTMPEIMPEVTDEAIIEALFAQRPYEEKVINSAFLEIPAEYQRSPDEQSGSERRSIISTRTPTLPFPPLFLPMFSALMQLH